MAQKYLLTGAGFSHNFHLPLAYHVWLLIFNDKRIHNLNKIGSVVRNSSSHNYEDLYSMVLDDPLYEEEKPSFLKIIDEIFNNQFEDISINSVNKSYLNIDLYDIIEFIKLFSELIQGHDGYVFTTNQDLFLERLFLSKSSSFAGPYIGDPLYNFKPGEYQFGINNRVSTLRTLKEFTSTNGIMPDISKIEELKSDNSRVRSSNPRTIPYYIKLHGSLGWRYANDEGKLPIIMGTHKFNRISEEPLLKEYLTTFEKSLCVDNSHLLTIGYSFSDKHINDVIIRAMNNHNLSLHIISPIKFPEYKKTLVDKLSSSVVTKNLRGYYEATLTDIFPYQSPDKRYPSGISSETHWWHMLRKNFFMD